MVGAHQDCWVCLVEGVQMGHLDHREVVVLHSMGVAVGLQGREGREGFHLPQVRLSQGYQGYQVGYPDHRVEGYSQGREGRLAHREGRAYRANYHLLGHRRRHLRVHRVDCQG